MLEGPTPYELDIPSHFPPVEIPIENPMTVEGIELGRHLFWDTRMSRNNTISCASCHAPQYAFSDNIPFSSGVNGDLGKRNSMVLQNLAWVDEFLWDGAIHSLEEQILLPVMDSTEMDNTWSDFLNEVRYDNLYRELFYNAFGTLEPDSILAAKAIAQFLRTMISGNSKYDKVLRLSLIQSDAADE